MGEHCIGHWSLGILLESSNADEFHCVVSGWKALCVDEVCYSQSELESISADDVYFLMTSWKVFGPKKLAVKEQAGKCRCR